MKKLIEKIVEEEIQKLILEASTIPDRNQIQKVLKTLPINTITQLYGKSIYNLGDGRYIYPFPTENIVTDQELSQELEDGLLQAKNAVSFEEGRDKKLTKE